MRGRSGPLLPAMFSACLGKLFSIIIFKILVESVEGVLPGGNTRGRTTVGGGELGYFVLKISVTSDTLSPCHYK